MDILSNYIWYLEIGDMNKASFIVDRLPRHQALALETAVNGLYPAAERQGKGPYTYLILERATYSKAYDVEDIDFAAILQYCQLWDRGKHDQAMDFIKPFSIDTYSKLQEFIELCDIQKPLVPQLTIIRDW